MHCPYCNCEMKRGIIDAKSAPIWTPRDKFTVFKRRDEIRLGDFLQLNAPAAYYCETCGKIIVDLNEQIKLTAMDNGLE